jgi:ABC-type lipoprotein release transport system permease subunit
MVSRFIPNLILYGTILYFLYESTIKEWDPWNAFVVAFVLFVAIITTLMPHLHASKTSPGEYPYDDD